MDDAVASALVALTVALAAGVLVGVMLTLGWISTEDYGTARRSRHQRDGRNPKAAGLDWIPEPERRVIKGTLVTWRPTDDGVGGTLPLDPPDDVDWRRPCDA